MRTWTRPAFTDTSGCTPRSSKVRSSVGSTMDWTAWVRLGREISGIGIPSVKEVNERCQSPQGPCQYSSVGNGKNQVPWSTFRTQTPEGLHKICCKFAIVCPAFSLGQPSLILNSDTYDPKP